MIFVREVEWILEILHVYAYEKECIQGNTGSRTLGGSSDYRKPVPFHSSGIADLPHGTSLFLSPSLFLFPFSLLLFSFPFLSNIAVSILVFSRTATSGNGINASLPTSGVNRYTCTANWNSKRMHLFTHPSHVPWQFAIFLR